MFHFWKLVFENLLLFHRRLYIPRIVTVFIQRHYVFSLPARTSQCHADSLGADIKSIIAGQFHLVLQPPEPADIVLVYHEIIICRYWPHGYVMSRKISHEAIRSRNVVISLMMSLTLISLPCLAWNTSLISSLSSYYFLKFSMLWPTDSPLH